MQEDVTMDHLEHPPFELWESRRQWFEATENQEMGEGSYLVSEQACALSADVQAAFCAGAWVAVIVLAMAVTDAALRETELPGHTGSTKDLLDDAGANPNLQQLRRRRNALVHVNPDHPAITVDQKWSDRRQLESEAREAIQLMFEAFFIGPWT